MSSDVQGKVGWENNDIEAIVATARASLVTGQMSLGMNTAAFERVWPAGVEEEKGHTGTVLVGNGTQALELAWRVLDCAHVIVPEMTVPMVKWAPARVARDRWETLGPFGVTMVDVDEYLCADLRAIDAELAKVSSKELRTGRYGVCYVATGGLCNPAFPQAAARWRSMGVKVVVDLSHAHGVSLNGYGLHTFGDVATWSFYATKVLTAGEGGAVWFASYDNAKKARVLANQGKERGSGLFVAEGFNYRASELVAATMAHEAIAAEAIYAKRRRVSDMYDAADLPGIHRRVPNLRSTFYKYVVSTEGTAYGPNGADALEAALREQGVRCTGRVHGYADNGGKPWRGDRARQWATGHVCLPVGRLMTEDDATRVIEAWRQVSSV